MQVARKHISATEARNLRTLLLLNVFTPEEIGGRIAQAREEAGLRQEDLADLIGVATRTIQNYEAAATKPYGKLRAIAEATGRNVEWLLHGDANEAHPTDLATLHRELAATQAMVEAILRHLGIDLPRDEPGASGG